MRRPSLSIAAFTLASLTVPATVHAAPSAAVQAAVISSDRPEADKEADAARKPAELLEFTGVKPGDTVADFMPGGGYVTRLFSKTVGAGGTVYAVVPSEIAIRFERAAAGAKAVAAEPGFANVSYVETPMADLAMPAAVDIFWTSQNYHDLYNGSGPEVAGALAAGVFKALKPGGVFVITDHAAKAGTSRADATPLHRIDPALITAQMIAIGFVLDGESDVLANPEDAKDKPVFDPSVRGHSDKFALRFRKPAS